MKFRTTYLLLFVFIALLGYVYVFEINKKPADKPEDRSTWVLTLSAADVQQISITDQGRSATYVRGGEDIWFIDAVGGPEADALRVGSIVASLAGLRSSRVLTDTAEGLAAYGLQNPGMTVTMLAGESQRETLLVGAKNPQGSSFYAQTKGNAAVHLVYASLIDDLKRLVTEPAYQPTPTPAAEPPAATTPTQ